MICAKEQQAQFVRRRFFLPMILGLTGGIGCGKSTAARFFAELGFRRIDTDAIVRNTVLTDASVVARIRARFGSGVLSATGVLDRAKLANAIFNDDEARRWLEALIHPKVREHWQAELLTAPKAAWVVEIPLLFENGLEKKFDFVVCIACSEPLQLARLEQRGMARTLAEQRISKQLPLARKIELSDFVLSNNGTPAFLQQQVARLVAHLGIAR